MSYLSLAASSGIPSPWCPTAASIDRALGLKKLQLHTASASTDATIKGLEAPLADALRTRLAHQARERMSGL